MRKSVNKAATALWFAGMARSESGRRGAGLLEYVLIGLVSIAIFGILYALFPSFFSGLITRMGSQISNVSP